MINELLLLSGNDIPYMGASISVHQPTIKEIAYIGEDNFYLGCEVLKISKQSLVDVDKTSLENISNFEILMSIMKEKNPTTLKQVVSAKLVLALLFGEYQIIYGNNVIILRKEEENNINEEHYITKDNFNELQDIISEMFCLSSNNSQEDYNPANATASAIAEKLKKGRQKAANAKDGGSNNNKKIAILSRYISILSIGLQKDYDSLLNCTVFQLYEDFKRFELKYQSDMVFKMRLAGAKDVPETEDWMKDLHP